MKIDFTPFVRPRFLKRAKRIDSWPGNSEKIQVAVLKSLLGRAAATEYGKKYGFADISKSDDPYRAYTERVPLVEYEDIRPLVMRMINGEKDVLWRDVCRDFAQSSGTSGGKSKFIPITKDSLSGNHYRGAEDAVAHYLRNKPHSKVFSGKGFILGGSFSNTLGIAAGKVHVGDLSATLINRIGPYADFVRIPDKKTALLPDWDRKLPALVDAALKSDVTNISGVPSWFMTVLKRIIEKKGAKTIGEVWPNLEVFFHGGISFEPYREEYDAMTEGLDMTFVETYNASEGFFATQNSLDDHSLLLIIDRDIFFEFIPVEGDDKRPRPVWDLEKGVTYELVISASNGLWRYRVGDTVRVTSTDPVKIKIAGRTKSFINAFGEELMEDNAERAIAAACKRTGSHILNYTAAPVFAKKKRKGHHEWLIEWDDEPTDIKGFSMILDEELRKLNSDYDAKRKGSIFLAEPKIVTAKKGLFDRWLKSSGSGKLGGQRKVPRLCNNREIIDNLLELNKL